MKRLLIILMLLSSTCQADIKKINGVWYGNVCRNGNMFSVLFADWYYKPIGSKCDLVNFDFHTIVVVGQGRITYE